MMYVQDYDEVMPPIAQNFAVPGNLQSVELCRTSGALATPECKFARTTYQAQLPQTMIPQRQCVDHSGVLASFPTGSSGSSPAPASYAGSDAPSRAIPVAPAVPPQTVAAPEPPPSLGGPVPPPAFALPPMAPPSLSAPAAPTTAVARQPTAEQTPPPGASYRMIRRQNGFIFEHSR